MTPPGPLFEMSQFSRDLLFPTTASRAPTKLGTTDVLPPGTLVCIALKAQTTPDALATLTVSNSLETYSAILEYAALSQPPKCAAPGVQKPHPLFIVPDDHFIGRRNKYDHTEEDFSYERDGGVTGGKGIDAKRTASDPSILYGLGETEISWPPPPELTAERLVQERDARSSKKALELEEKSHVLDDGNGKAPISDGKAICSSEGKCDVLTTDEEIVGAHNKVNRNVIYLVHYSLDKSREILLASAEGSQVLRKFAREVLQWSIDKEYREPDVQKFAMHRFRIESGDGYWEHEGMKKARPVSSVVLADGMMDAILADVRHFIGPDCKKWYGSHGLPHRRSYMFYGEPGTGKTSTIRAIASKFRFNCCFLGLTDSSFSNQMLADALQQIPSNALLVLEDVDTLFNEDRKSENSSSLTFSGMLNALDGLISRDGIIITMTTNHIDRLDKALLRGGRVDRQFHFGQPSQDQIRRLFLSFYPNADDDLAVSFAKAVFSRPEGRDLRSIATLQQLFILNRESSAEECAARLGDFCEMHFSRTKGDRGIYN